MTVVPGFQSLKFGAGSSRSKACPCPNWPAININNFVGHDGGSLASCPHTNQNSGWPLSNSELCL